jgi:phosphatidylglycerol lysyltransferase
MFIPGESPFDPAHDPDGIGREMAEISAEWLKSHPGGERGFCMGRFELERLRESWLAVAWNTNARRVEAFCTWVPIWARRGWSIDLMRRRKDSLTGSTEFLVVKTVERARDRGDALISLSLSALAKVEGTAGPDVIPADASAGDGAPEAALPPGAITDDRAREFLMERLARFYDFKGLFRWKSKFAPAFEDRYLVYTDPLALPRVARALLRVQSPAGLLSYFKNAA